LEMERARESNDTPARENKSPPREALEANHNAAASTESLSTSSSFSAGLSVDDGDDDDEIVIEIDDDVDDDDDRDIMSVYAISSYPRVNPTHRVERPFELEERPVSQDDGTM